MKKLWGIRHIRYFYLKVKAFEHAEQCAKMGIGLGFVNEHDIKTLEDIWSGKF